VQDRDLEMGFGVGRLALTGMGSDVVVSKGCWCEQRTVIRSQACVR